MTRRTDLALVAVPFAVSGVIHLVRPEVFERIVPRFLPRHRELVLASGVAELVCAAAVIAAWLLVMWWPSSTSKMVGSDRSAKQICFASRAISA